MTLEQFIINNSEPGETWKNIPEYEDLYMISTHGRVISKERSIIDEMNRAYISPIKFMKININEGRKSVTLRKDHRSKKFSLPLLMATIFLPKPNRDQVLKFKDNNNSNCNIDNIYWGDKIGSKNCYHRINFDTKDLEGEIWKDIPEYEGLYAISNKGRVKALKRDIETSNRIIHKSEQILTPILTQSGYYNIQLSDKNKGRKRKNFAIHRLVASAFIENPNNYPYVDHIDTNPTNNCVENLRWVTPTMNMANELTRQALSESLRGQLINRTWNSKPIAQLKDGVLINTFPSIAEATRQGYSNSAIFKCLSGKQNKHKGFTWIYLSDYQELTPK